MATMTRTRLARFLALSEALRMGRDRMLTPQDLPGRFGRVIKAIDRVLAATGTEAVLAGGWAVWRHGFDARVTQDVDVAIAANRVDEFLRVASESGFQILPVPEGRWPKLVHRDTGIEVDLLAEGAQPGSADRPAPTRIPAPSLMGAAGPVLTYIRLESLVELKLAANRRKDAVDVVELIRSNQSRVSDICNHLAGVCPIYCDMFNKLVAEASNPDS